MEELKNLPESTVAHRFEKLFDAELVEVGYKDLPPQIAEYLETQSRKLVRDETYRVGNFDTLYSFTHANEDITYVGQQDKTYDTNNRTERLTFFVDTREGEITGYLEMRLALTDLQRFFKNKPFVGFTRTHESFQKQGLALRRLEEANAYSLAEYGFPLNSDTLLTDEAKRVWERLVEAGRAEQYKENDNPRFRFVEQK